MTRRSLALFMTLTTALACGLAAATAYLVAARTADHRPVPGRYQPVLVDEFGGGREKGELPPPYVKGKKLVLVDTATGQCWEQSGGRWLQMGNPAHPNAFAPQD